MPLCGIIRSPVSTVNARASKVTHLCYENGKYIEKVKMC
jgi:hypothetical protein